MKTTNAMFFFYGHTAQAVGVEGAVLLETLALWMRQGGGPASIYQIQKKLPFWDESKIQQIAKDLRDAGLVKIRNSGGEYSCTPEGDKLVKEAIGQTRG